MHVGVRWTIGDVNERGFDALRLSIHGAAGLFGPDAAYAVCVNTVPSERVRRRIGPVPAAIEWRQCDAALPAWLRDLLGDGMAEGAAWKLSPPRVFPDRHEISLDNDCILWAMPEGMSRFLAGARRCLLAEDVTRAFGIFTDLCGEGARNLGIRGLPPGFDLEHALREALRRREALGGAPVRLRSELDEQGWQAAALSIAAGGEPEVVRMSEVTICSPFWPHRPQLGTCGAHFVGLNARTLPWRYYDRPADEWMAAHWRTLAPAVRRLVGA